MVGRVSSPRFVGRGQELEVLLAALKRARESVGSAVLVGAEAGMGKSRLIGEMTEAARESGATVIVGECLPLGEGELPYAPIVGALRSLARARDWDGMEALAAREGSQARLFEHLLGLLLEGAAEAPPLVLVVEDLQWSDRSTRDFLAFLVRRTRREPVALIVSYRSDEVHRRHPARPFLVELERSGQATRVDLSPFTRGEIREQVAAILGTAPEPALVERLLERSEGNPFFAEELLVAAGAPGTGLPESLRDALLLRVEGQSPEAETVVRVAAVAGRKVDHALLETVAGLPEAELVPALREAIDGQVLMHDPATTGYAFRHALLREAVYDDLLPGERRAFHLTLARALDERPELAGSRATAAAELAYHWYAARELSEALVASLDAAIAAEGLHAYGEALFHYERALEIWDQVGDPGGGLPLPHGEVMRRASEAANLSGAIERATAWARKTLESIDPRDAVSVALAHERLGRFLWTAGRVDDALPTYRRAVELMPAEPPSEERAHVLAAEAQVLMLCSRYKESEVLCDEALAIAQAVGASRVEAHVLNTVCANRAESGDREGGVEAAARAREIASRLGMIEEIGRSYVNASDALDQAGRVEESIALATEGVETARRFGADGQHGDFLRGEIVARLLRSSRWDEADERLRDLADRDLAGVNAGVIFPHVAQLHAERGEFDAAQQWLQRAEDALSRSVGSMWLSPLTEARAALLLWTGRPAAALEDVEKSLEEAADTEYLFATARLYDLGVRACADLAAAAPGDEAARRDYAARADALIARLNELIAAVAGTVAPRVVCTRGACLAERARVDGPADPTAWEAVRRGWEEIGDRYLAAHARWREAEALVATGADRPKASQLVSEAHAVAVELRAGPMREQLEGLARRGRLELTGASPAADPGEPAAPDTLDLTPREIEVLALLAEGLTNREIAAELFISDKTASVHVSRILVKLAVPNRAAAAAAAQRLGVRRDQPPATPAADA